MIRFLCSAAALFALTAALALAAPQKAAKPAAAAVPKQYNQFVTVEEFVRARRAPKTLVSVEGYAVLGVRTPDGARLSLVDSTDHVLNTQDADGAARAGAKATVPVSWMKGSARRAWAAQGIQRFVMYTGAGRAQKALHDTVSKLRLTGRAAPGRAVLSPVTKIEYQDDNGDWKVL